LKKLLFCLIAVGFTVTAWGQSIGIGYYGTLSQGGGFENRTVFRGKTVQTLLDMSQSFGMAFFVFFELKYLETSVGLFWGDESCFGGGVEYKMRRNSPLIAAEKTVGFDFPIVNFSLMGKYPFAFPRERYRIFPLLGCEYNFVFSPKIDGEKADNPFAWNQLWFKLGAGIDYRINDKWFFVFEYMYGLRLPGKGERDLADDMKKSLENSFYEDFGIIQNFTSDTLIGHGTSFRMAVGYKF
jgi:opacity protein-like surface antigen